MSLKDDLIAARALINTPEKWGKGRFRNALTGETCVRGACAIATGSHFLSPKAEVLELALSACLAAPRAKPNQLAIFNDADETTHADVMALFDRAIANVENSHVQ